MTFLDNTITGNPVVLIVFLKIYHTTTTTDSNEKMHTKTTKENSLKITTNRPRSIYQNSSMAPRLSGQNCKFFKFPLSLNSQKRLRYKENNIKYRGLTWKPRSHVRILIYRTWPITKSSILEFRSLYFLYIRFPNLQRGMSRSPNSTILIVP